MKTLIAATLAAALAGCGRPVRTDVPAPPSPAADFALQDLSGRTVKLSDYRGKTVLLDFWATWCVPCKESIPLYIRMQEKLRGKGFVVIGVDEGEKADAVADHAKSHGMTYPLLLDTDASLFRAYGARSLPAAFLIDASGSVRGRWDGFDAATGLDVEHAADALLGAKPVE